MKLLIVTQGQQLKNYTSLGNCLSSAFESLGVVHSLYDLSLYYNRYLFFMIRKTPFVQNVLLKKINADLLKHIDENGYSHVLVIKGSFLLPETVEELSTSGKVTIACYNPDAPFNSAVNSVYPSIKKSVKFYHHYFIWSKKLMRDIISEGVKNVHYLPFAIDPTIIYPVAATTDYNEVSLISAVDSDRQDYVDAICKCLQKDNKFSFVIYGDGWKPNPLVTIKGAARGVNFLETMAASKVNLNILRMQNKGSINMRTFEIPAVAAFSLHERSEEAAEFFEENKEMVFFSSAEELIDKAAFYLKHESVRLQIAKAGYSRVSTSDYTYTRMAKKIIEKITR